MEGPTPRGQTCPGPTEGIMRLCLQHCVHMARNTRECLLGRSTTLDAFFRGGICEHSQLLVVAGYSARRPVSRLRKANPQQRLGSNLVSFGKRRGTSSEEPVPPPPRLVSLISLCRALEWCTGGGCGRKGGCHKKHPSSPRVQRRRAQIRIGSPSVKTLAPPRPRLLLLPPVRYSPG